MFDFPIDGVLNINFQKMRKVYTSTRQDKTRQDKTGQDKTS